MKKILAILFNLRYPTEQSIAREKLFWKNQERRNRLRKNLKHPPIKGMSVRHPRFYSEGVVPEAYQDGKFVGYIGWDGKFSTFNSRRT